MLSTACCHHPRGAAALKEFLGASSTHAPSPPSLGGETDHPTPSHPTRLPGQSFAIEHRVHKKKSKFRPFLGAAGVEDAKRFVTSVLEASGRLGPDAVIFLEYLRTLYRFPILRLHALTSVISAKHNAQMAR